MPAHSSTARTGPPAMTPVPVAAGFSSTRPAPCSPTISCGIVRPVGGSSTIVALGGVDRLAHRFGHLVRLAGRDADLALPVADGHERVEREPPAALHDLGHAVDGDDVLDEVARVLAVAAIAAAAAAPPAAARRRRARRRPPRPLGARRAAPRRRRRRRPSAVPSRAPRVAACRLVSHLELQSAFAGAVGDRLHAAMVPVARAVEHDLGDARLLGLLGEQLARPPCPGPPCPCPRPAMPSLASPTPSSVTPRSSSTSWA